jgi:hypothetical protein
MCRHRDLGAHRPRLRLRRSGSRGISPGLIFSAVSAEEQERICVPDAAWRIESWEVALRLVPQGKRPGVVHLSPPARPWGVDKAVHHHPGFLLSTEVPFEELAGVGVALACEHSPPGFAHEPDVSSHEAPPGAVPPPLKNIHARRLLVQTFDRLQFLATTGTRYVSADEPHRIFGDSRP